MKRFYILSIALFSILFVNSAFAQSNKKINSLEGLWQMCFNACDSVNGGMRIGNTFKVLSKDGHITNFTMIPGKPAIITGYGTYKVISKNLYKEAMIKNIHLPMLDGKTNFLQYKLKENGNILHLKFYIEKDRNGNTLDAWYNETWKRLSMPEKYPENLVR